jgi:hypothetical protein
VPESVDASLDDLSLDFDLEPEADSTEASSSAIPARQEMRIWI